MTDPKDQQFDRSQLVGQCVKCDDLGHETSEHPEPTCTCGSPDAYSLNPAEVLVHRVDEPCYIAEAKR